MPPFHRASNAIRTARLLHRGPAQSSTPTIVRHTLAAPSTGNAIRMASTQSTHGAAEHTQTGEAPDAHGPGDHYDPPGGWLWGVPPGEHYKNEGWEGLWFYGFYGSLVLTAIAYAWKPDTSIETWALEEAKRRLQIEGILPEEE